MTEPEKPKDDVAKLARADLLVVCQREGDPVALEHAAHLAGAAVEFIVTDLVQPKEAAGMLDVMRARLRETHPETRLEVRIPNDGPDALAALMGVDTRAELHEIVRTMSVDHATAVATMTARTAMAFLIEVGRVDRFREVAAEAAQEVARLDAVRDPRA